MTRIVEAEGLTKRFGKIEALAGLDLTVEEGQVVAVLGPNGAGKTTFVRTVATLLRPDEGTIRVAGYDVLARADQVRRLLGLAGQHAAVEDAMTGRENVEMVARLYGQGRLTAHRNAARVLGQLGLTDAADRLVRTYSGGMRRRLDLGASLVGAPRLLLLTTQYLDEADHLASRIVIIDHGRVIADGTPSELKTRAGRDVVEVHTAHAGELAAAATVLHALGVAEAVVDAATRRVSIAVDDGTDHLTAAVRALDEHDVKVDDIALRRPTLDEVFLALTGVGLDSEAGEDGSRTRAA